MGRRVAKLSYSLLLLVLLFYTNVVGSGFCWKRWHDNTCVGAWQSLPHLFPLLKSLCSPLKSELCKPFCTSIAFPQSPNPCDCSGDCSKCHLWSSRQWYTFFRALIFFSLDITRCSQKIKPKIQSNFLDCYGPKWELHDQGAVLLI